MLNGQKVYTYYVIIRKGKRMLNINRRGRVLACVAHHNFDIVTKVFNPYLYVDEGGNPL